MVNCTVNCTEKLVTGHFSGLLNDNISAVELLINNTWPDIQRDCEDAELPVTLQTLFAVLFSGVTGIMAGANLSGDLKNPSHAIPVGTTIACTVTFGCYAIFFVLTAATCDRALLYHDCQYMAVMLLLYPLFCVHNTATFFLPMKKREKYRYSILTWE